MLIFSFRLLVIHIFIIAIESLLACVHNSVMLYIVVYPRVTSPVLSEELCYIVIIYASKLQPMLYYVY